MLGWFGVKWSLEDGGKRFVLSVDAPSGTSGVIPLPILPSFAGTEVQGGGQNLNVQLDGEDVSLNLGTQKLKVGGGNHTVVIS